VLLAAGDVAARLLLLRRQPQRDSHRCEVARRRVRRGLGEEGVERGAGGGGAGGGAARGRRRGRRRVERGAASVVAIAAPIAVAAMR
jgi:hypothetical protein